MAKSLTGEEAVRLYLLYLEDPAKLRDEQQIKKLTAELQRAKDPVERLRATSALHKSQVVDEREFRDAFVRSAKQWAEAEGIVASAFRDLGVPDEVLADAGLEVDGRRRRRAQPSRPAARKRARAVPVEEIKAKVPDSGTFTVRDLEQRSGGSTATVRKAIGELIGGGAIEDLGPATDYAGRGRAPTVYRVTG